ncbi:MAG: hypothetical protein ABI381_16135 [Jatrophihabitantaceae bacterium]
MAAADRRGVDRGGVVRGGVVRAADRDGTGGLVAAWKGWLLVAGLLVASATGRWLPAGGACVQPATSQPVNSPATSPDPTRNVAIKASLPGSWSWFWKWP